MNVVKLNKNAHIPVRATAGSVGYDLRACEDVAIPAQHRRIVKTGLSIAVPDGYYGRVAPRSGLSVKYEIDVGAGVIDRDYRGEIGVVLINNGVEKFQVHSGDKIAQLIIEACITPEIILVDKLDETSRGSGGFGSTGKC